MLIPLLTFLWQKASRSTSRRKKIYLDIKLPIECYIENKQDAQLEVISFIKNLVISDIPVYSYLKQMHILELNLQTNLKHYIKIEKQVLSYVRNDYTSNLNVNTTVIDLKKVISTIENLERIEKIRLLKRLT